MKRFSLGIFAALACLSAIVTWAAPILPPAVGSAFCSSNNPPETSSDPSSCVLGGASASVETGPFVSLAAHASSAANVASFNAISSLQYSFEVIGGNPGDQVPLLIATILDTSATPHSFAAALMNVTTSLGATLTRVCTDGSCPGSSFDGTVSLTAVSGETGSVQLTIQAANTFLFGGTADAFADPHIYVDPAFGAASLYSVVVSDGVGNSLSTAVPEPCIVALLVVALAGLSYRWRARSFRSRTDCPNSLSV